MLLAVCYRLAGFVGADRPVVEEAGLSVEEQNRLRLLRSQAVPAPRGR